MIPTKKYMIPAEYLDMDIRLAGYSLSSPFLRLPGREAGSEPADAAEPEPYSRLS